MIFKARKYRLSNLIVGGIILMMSLNWIYQNVDEYHFWNFSTGWKCGTGAPTNGELWVQMLLGLAGVIASVLVIENRLRPFLGGVFQFLLICGGIYVEMLPYSRW